MISSFTICGFKAFKDLELPHLSRITLLGGKNNVGKTSVLEALFTFFDRGNPRMLLNQLGWRGVGSVSLDPEAMWGPTFNNFNMEQQITLSAVIDGKEERMTLRFDPNPGLQAISAQAPANGDRTSVIKTDTQPTPPYRLDIRFTLGSETVQESHLSIIAGQVQLKIDPPDTRLRPGALIPLRGHEDPNEIATRFGQLDLVGKQDTILKFLKIIEPRLLGLSSITTGNVSMVYGDIGLSKKIPIPFMGDGMARMMNVIAYIATARHGLVMIDEVESGVHHSVMPKVWQGIAEAAREFDCQIVATTHSYECIQAAQQGLAGEFANDFSYTRLDRKEDVIKARHFDFDILQAALDANMEVR